MPLQAIIPFLSQSAKTFVEFCFKNRHAFCQTKHSAQACLQRMLCLTEHTAISRKWEDAQRHPTWHGGFPQAEMSQACLQKNSWLNGHTAVSRKRDAAQRNPAWHGGFPQAGTARLSVLPPLSCQPFIDQLHLLRLEVASVMAHDIRHQAGKVRQGHRPAVFSQAS